MKAAQGTALRGTAVIRRRGGNHSWHAQLPLYLMFAPFAVLFLLFTVLPVASSIVLSFFSYDMISLPKFSGLSNYIQMFLQDDIFPIAVKNTLLFSVITGPIGFLLSFMLAWMINEFGPKTRSLLSFLFYSPALGGSTFFIWQVLFSGDRLGYVNTFLINLGIINSPIQWFKTEPYAVYLVIAVQLWVSLGVSFLANIAGLQNVNPEIYEAGAIDGIRNRWQEVWYITLPPMRNILLFSCVMQIQASFSIGAIPMALTGFPSVNYMTETIVTHLIDVGTLRYEMGYAAAISVFLFAIMAIARLLIGKLINMTGK